MGLPEGHPQPRKSGEVLHAKLMPPHLHAGLIPRPELLRSLDEGLARRLTILSAPAGFGKSTLLGQWIASREVPFAWVTLDPNDNDPARFWTYVVSALRTLESSIGRSTLAGLSAAPIPPFENLLTPLLNDLARLARPCVLVLEDYQVIQTAEIQRGLGFFIQNLSSALHLVLLTRGEADLPLGRLRAQGDLLEIGASSLRFTPHESASFLHQMLGPDFPQGASEKLFHKTEGWPAGLRLAALSLKNKTGIAEPERLIDSFSGSDRFVGDYLFQEVFSVQAASTQDFLLKTCFLDRLSGPLCDAVTGGRDSAARLEGLERENLFVVQLESAGGRLWYRYNPLFAESVQSLARKQLGEPGLAALFEKASAWYARQQLYDEAIEAALTGHAYESAISLLETYIDIHELRELQTLERWLERIPAEQVLAHASICFTYAQVILYSQDRFAPSTAARLEPWLQAAETAWRQAPEHPQLGQLLAFRANVVLWQGDLPKAFEFARQSLAELPESDVSYRGSSLLILSHESLNAGRISQTQDRVLEARALLGAAQNIFGVLASLQVLAEVFFWRGELEQAEQVNQQILQEAVGDPSMLDDQGIACLNLARIAYERNDLDQAQPFASRALQLAEDRNNEFLRVEASICLAWIQAAHQSPALGRESLNLLIRQVQSPALARELLEAQGRLSLLAGEKALLKSWLQSVTESDTAVLQLQQEREAFTQARLLIADGEPSRALPILLTWRADAIENGRLRSQVQALCLEALARQAASQGKQAAAFLQEALELGRARGFRRIFLDEGPRLAECLQAHLAAMPERSLNLYATALLHAFGPASAGRADAALIEPLSQQELRVLRLLVDGLSNADIARELVVSPNTVKTHVKSIYRKLGISSREEARQLARELKLL